MSSPECIGYRLGTFHDTGAPEASADYTTLVVLHGYQWHSAIFQKLIPLSKGYNARLVLLNRRGYPGSTPYTDEERAAFPNLVPPGADSEYMDGAMERLGVFLRERAHELYDFLEDLVRAHNIPTAQPGKNVGGIVLVGWSFGAVMITSFLSNVQSFPAKDIDLQKYVRRVVVHDAGYMLMGYPAQEGMDQPALDPSLPHEQRAAAFDAWIGGCYAHGSTPDSLGKRPLGDPPSTISTLTPEEKAAMTHTCRLAANDLDLMTMSIGLQTGLIATLHQQSLYLPTVTAREGEGWGGVELRYLWCERSVPEVSYGMMLLVAELEEARRRGRLTRSVKIVRVKEGNHFVHWDRPDLAMRAFIGDKEDK